MQTVEMMYTRINVINVGQLKAFLSNLPDDLVLFNDRANDFGSVKGLVIDVDTFTEDDVEEGVFMSSEDAYGIAGLCFNAVY